MTVDEQPAPAAAPTASQLAIENYVASMRRKRLIYTGVLLAVVAGLVVFVSLMWAGSEVAHTRLHTAAQPAPSIALHSPSPVLRAAWHNGDHTAIGTPFSGGTVITYSNDSVRGRNGLTGAITWSYTRTDRIVCQAIQDEGVTVAVFRHGGNCDEVTGLDSATGARKWTRTLDKDGAPVQGSNPTYTVGPFTIMITTTTVIYAFDPGGGLDRWTYAPKGCTINGAALGSAGALISQTCTSPKCDGLTYCGTGPQLLLRDPTAGHSDEDKDKANPDQIKWLLLGNTAVPASADDLISAVDPATGQLLTFESTKGKSLASVPLAAVGTTGIVATLTAHAELLWITGTTYAVDASSKKLLWHVPTLSSPTVTQSPGGVEVSTPDLNHATLAAPGTTGIDLIDGRNGRVQQTISGAVATSAGRAYPFGSGFILAGPSTTVYQ